MKRYKFRKMYFQCIDKQVLSEGTQFTNAYRDKSYAESNMQTKTEHKLWEDKSIPLPAYSVEGFYLVPEALYDKILKPYVEGTAT